MLVVKGKHSDFRVGLTGTLGYAVSMYGALALKEPVPIMLLP